MTKFFTKNSYWCIAVIISAVLGWSLAGRSAVAAQNTEAAEISPSSSNKQQHLKSKGVTTPPERVTAQMASLRVASNPAERTRAILDLAQSIPVNEIAQWLNHDWFDLRSGYDYNLFMNILRERWANEDPYSYLTWASKNKPSDVEKIITKLADSEPEKLFNYLKSITDDNEFDYYAVRAIAKKNLPLALQFLTNIESKYPNSNSLSVYFTEFVKNSLKDLEANLDTLSPKLRKAAEVAILSKKIKDDPVNEINKLLNMPNGYALFEDASMHSSGNRDGIYDMFFAQFSELPNEWKKGLRNRFESLIYSSKNKSQWFTLSAEALGVTEEERQKIFSRAISNYYTSDENLTKEKIQISNGIKMEDSDRKRMLKNIFVTFSKDSPKTSEYLALLKDDAERAQMEQYLMRDEASKNAIVQKSWLSSLDENSDLYQITKLDSKQINDIVTEFKELPKESRNEKTKVILSSLKIWNFNSVTENTRPIIQQAIQEALNDPSLLMKQDNKIDTDKYYAIANYATMYAKEDSDAASAWMSSLPSGKEKSVIQNNFVANWMNDDPSAAKAWMENLPANEKKEVQAFLQKRKP